MMAVLDWLIKGAVAAAKGSGTTAVKTAGKTAAKQGAKTTPRWAGRAYQTGRVVTPRSGANAGRPTYVPNTGRVPQFPGQKRPTAATVRKATVPGGGPLKNSASVVGVRAARQGGVTRRTVAKEVVKANKKPIAVTTAAAGTAGLYGLGASMGPVSSSSADSRFAQQSQYRPMTAKPPYKNPMPQWALDGAGRRDNSYKGTYVGSTISKPKPKTPSITPSSTNGGGGRPRQAGPSRKQVQARRAAITKLLSKAETAAAAGNIQAAANFSAAALNRQKAGKGTAASMKRVTKVAQAYSTAAGRKKIENQEAGRTRLGKPPVKGKKG